jgi:hypothetical protein
MSQSEGQSQPLLLSPPWTPPTKQGANVDGIDNDYAASLSPVRPTSTNEANLELHEVRRALFHPDSGHGQGFNREPTSGLKTTLGRKDNTAHGVNDSRIPGSLSEPGHLLVSPLTGAAEPAVIERSESQPT